MEEVISRLLFFCLSAAGRVDSTSSASPSLQACDASGFDYASDCQDSDATCPGSSVIGQCKLVAEVHREDMLESTSLSSKVFDYFGCDFSPVLADALAQVRRTEQVN